jgi:hypothetical protein
VSVAAKASVVAVVLALGLAGCNEAGRGDRDPATPPAAQAGERKPAPQPVVPGPAAKRTSEVTLLRVPNGGIQPQAVTDARGTLHLIYFKGDKPAAGDLYYVRREPGRERFSEPIRVNSKPGSACAVGSVRGGQLAVGKGGRVHVVWNGVGTEYARLNDAGTAFEEQRNLMRETEHPDGGCTVAADGEGNVYVIWHGHKKGETGEDRRKVWVARSTDDGKTFALEEPAWKEPTGVCACCSTRALADDHGNVYLLYRSATAQVNRDIYLLTSTDRGKTFRQALLHRWKVPG